MIGFFPESYPDESLFSILSRYHRRAGYSDTAASARDLFGKTQCRSSVDLPANLAELVSRLPSGHTYSVDRFINRHTLLPFYSRFIPNRRLQQVYGGMAGSGGAQIHGRLGVNTFRGTPRTFRYCASCTIDDRNTLGEAYWHRFHQAPGVEVCTIHEEHLIHTDIQKASWGDRNQWLTAEEAIGEPSQTQTKVDNYFPIRLRVARDIQWLLDNPTEGTIELGHRQRYIKLFFERKACTYWGVFRSNISEEIRQYYSDDFLNQVRCPLREKHNWARKLVHFERITQHPLYHLLLIQFLGRTVEEFFALPEKRLPFREGPWPCLNRVSAHYGEKLIKRYESTVTQRNGRTPRGIFRCACGFAYSRIGPDKSTEDQYQIDRYISFGEEWDNRLRELYRSGQYSVYGLGRVLHVSDGTVIKQLRRLGLIASSSDIGCDRRRRSAPPEFLEQKRESCREMFLSAAKDHHSRSGLRKAIQPVDTWLRKNDREWWLANIPLPLRTKGKIQFDWQLRDHNLAAAVRTKAEEIFAQPGRPVMVSRTAVSRRLRIDSLVWKQPNKVPLTIRVLEEICENDESYAVRRVRWAAQYFLDERICPTRSQLCTKAAISRETARRERVQQGLEWRRLSILGPGLLATWAVSGINLHLIEN